MDVFGDSTIITDDSEYLNVVTMSEGLTQGDDIPIAKEISTICGTKIEAVKQTWSV